MLPPRYESTRPKKLATTFAAVADAVLLTSRIRAHRETFSTENARLDANVFPQVVIYSANIDASVVPIGLLL